MEEEEKKRLEEEEYKKNWASRWMANIEARTEKLAAKKEEKKVKETSALGGGFRNFVSKNLAITHVGEEHADGVDDDEQQRRRIRRLAASLRFNINNSKSRLSRLSPRFRMDDQLATYPTTSLCECTCYNSHISDD